MGKILKFPGGQELPGNGDSEEKAEKPALKKNRAIEHGLSGDEGRAINARRVGVLTQIAMIEISTRNWYRKAPEKSRQALEFRHSEFKGLEMAQLENRLLSSTPAEWREKPSYWRALVREYKSRK